MFIHLDRHVSARVVSPDFPFLENTPSDQNNNSVAMRLVYRDFEILFTGDLEKEGEERLLNSAWRLDSDVLKAGHHGSKTSSSDEFLDRVRPKTAVISCGVRNRYRHPHPTTLSKFRQRRIAVYRTDQQGEIDIETDGKDIKIKCAVNKLRTTP
jgi:competence protein ComEC